MAQFCHSFGTARVVLGQKLHKILIFCSVIVRFDMGLGKTRLRCGPIVFSNPHLLLREIFECDNYSPIPVDTEEEYKLVVSRFPFHDAEIEKVTSSSTRLTNLYINLHVLTVTKKRYP